MAAPRRCGSSTRAGEDWSLAQQRSLEVKPGQIYELSGWVRVQGRGNTTLCVTLRDAGDKVTDWSFAGQTAGATEGWRRLRSRFVVPTGTKTMQPRLIGYGPATVWFDDASLVLQGSVDQMRRKDLPATLRAENRVPGCRSPHCRRHADVTDRRSGRRWTQWPRSPIVVLDAKAVESGFHLTMLDPATHAAAGGHDPPGTAAARGCLRVVRHRAKCPAR